MEVRKMVYKSISNVNIMELFVFKTVTNFLKVDIENNIIYTNDNVNVEKIINRLQKIIKENNWYMFIYDLDKNCVVYHEYKENDKRYYHQDIKPEHISLISIQDLEKLVGKDVIIFQKSIGILSSVNSYIFGIYSLIRNYIFGSETNNKMSIDMLKLLWTIYINRHKVDINPVFTFEDTKLWNCIIEPETFSIKFEDEVITTNFITAVTGFGENDYLIYNPEIIDNKGENVGKYIRKMTISKEGDIGFTYKEDITEEEIREIFNALALYDIIVKE